MDYDTQLEVRKAEEDESYLAEIEQDIEREVQREKELAEVRRAEAAIRAQIRARAEVDAYAEDIARDQTLVSTRWMYLGSLVEVTEVDTNVKNLAYRLMTGSQVGSEFGASIRSFCREATRVQNAEAAA